MRTANRLVALLVGLALMAFAAVAGVEAVLVRLDRPAWLIPRSDWHEGLGQLEWTSPTLRLVLGATVAAGLALLVAQMVPRRPLCLPLTIDHADRTMEIERRSLEQRARRVASEDVEVEMARPHLGRRRLRVKVTLPPGTDHAAVRQRLERRLEEMGGSLRLARPPAVRVHASTSRARAR